MDIAIMSVRGGRRTTKTPAATGTTSHLSAWWPTARAATAAATWPPLAGSTCSALSRRSRRQRRGDPQLASPPTAPSSRRQADGRAAECAPPWSGRPSTCSEHHRPGPCGEPRLLFRGGRCWRAPSTTAWCSRWWPAACWRRPTRVHPQRNVLLSALGSIEDAGIERPRALPVEPGDVFLLCTDGVWEYVDHPSWKRPCAQATRPRNGCAAGARVQHAAPHKPRHDNFTALGDPDQRTPVSHLEVKKP